MFRFISLLVIGLLSYTKSFCQTNEIIVYGTKENADNSRKYALIGYVKLINGESLPGATVKIKNENTGVVADLNGRYRINLTPGAYTLLFQFLGMRTQNVSIEIYRNATLDVVLEPNDLSLEQVIVEADPERNVTSTLSGVTGLKIKDISSIPTFLGEIDILKSLQTLPGVNSAGEGSGGLNVRGGKSDQNLITLNGGLLYNSTHILGFFSSFNPGTIEGFTLYRGYIPPEWGGRVSSVLDVQLKQSHEEKFKYSGSIGPISGRMVVEGPISANTGIIVGGRTSYTDYILSNSKSALIRGSKANFYDLTAATNIQFEKSTISVFGYTSNDFFRFNDAFAFGWNNHLAGLKGNSLLSSNLTLNWQVGIGKYESEQSDKESQTSSKRSIGIGFGYIKTVLAYTPTQRKFQLKGGIEFTRTHLDPEKIVPFGILSSVNPEKIEKENGQEFSLFSSLEYPLNDDWSFAIGARHTFYSALGAQTKYLFEKDQKPSINSIIDTITYTKNQNIVSYAGTEPRLSIRWKISPSQSLKLSYGRFYQYQHSLSNTIAPSPTDVWQMSNQSINPLRSDNFSLGLYKNLKNNAVEFSFDIFYRVQNDLLDYIDFAKLVANPLIEIELLSGKGKSYGAEWYLHKKRGKWTGWISYTFSRARIQLSATNPDGSKINQGRFYPVNYDRPHNISLVSRLQLGRKSSFDSNFTFISGRPITGIESVYSLGAYPIPSFSERNKYRIPDYFRFDVGFTVAENIWKDRDPKYENKRFRTATTFSVYNLLSRNNAYSVYFIRPEFGGDLPLPHQFSVIGNAVPSITVNFTF